MKRLEDLTRSDVRDLEAGGRVLAKCSVCKTEHAHQVMKVKKLGTGGKAFELEIAPVAQGGVSRYYCGIARKVRVTVG